MRLHRLEVEAFGPFAQRVVVDLDEVSSGGLFLVHGPTGSGKTSLLDAVCFALYADVPGARGKQGLRSDHAAPGVRPEVALELTVGGRRLRVTRTPAWHRPKKRGPGTTPVQATVVLEEREGPDWRALSTRHDEVADIVKDLLGMGLQQFASVVLLPQGEFATFLRAEPEERRRLLERLFDIGVFSDVEDWLAEARRASGAALDEARSGLDTDLLRLDDALTGVPGTADEPEAEPLPALGGTPVDALPARLTEVGEILGGRLTETLALVDAAEAAETLAQAALADARELAGHRRRGLEAGERFRRLGADADTQAARRDELARAERAATVSGHLRAHDRAVGDAASARTAATARETAVRAVLGHATGVDADSAATLLARVRDLDPVAEAVTREAAPARELAAALDDATTRRDALVAERDDLAEALPGLRTALEEAEVEAARLRSEAARVPELDTTAGVLRARLTALDEVNGRRRLEALAPRLLAARDDVLARQSTLLELRQRRLDQMAAELAAALAPGSPCPVCGAAEHPAPAVASDPVRPEDLDRAESLLETSTAVHRDLDHERAALEAAVEARLEDLDGADRATVEAGLADTASATEAARAARAAVDGAETRRDLCRAAASSAGVRHERTLATLEMLERRVEEISAEATAARDRLESAVAAHATCPCGSTDPAGHLRTRDALAALTQAHSEVEAAETRREAAAGDLAAALDAADLGSAADARSAVRDTASLDRLRDAVQAHERGLDAARAVLAEPVVAAALEADAPDLEALETAARDARRRVLAAASAHEAVARAARALEQLRPGLEHRCADIGDRADRQARIRELADAVGGTGGDNTLKMRLTSFVLAARLEKVAVLANERLAVMGGGRYALEHSDGRAARGARSGLGLRVLDQWTGRVRDTASLSGGESFMASLALALGLADAVREESGGRDLGTLFVDEGFGTLDDESLEQVLTVLDGLREGGRAVGVVSHVADLRGRVPHQVVVTKGTAGSTVSTRTGTEAPAA